MALARKDAGPRGAEVVYASCVFSSDSSRRRIERLQDRYGDAVVVGGSGVDTRQRLPPEIEAQRADYSLYPDLNDRAIGFLTRGCPRRCPFCVVPDKEGAVRRVSDLDSVLQGRKKLILLDDNILSHPESGEILEEMASRRLQVNFTQTLDIRLLDPEKVALLKRIRCTNSGFTRNNHYFSLNDTRGLGKVRRNYDLFGFTASDNVAFICMYGFDTTLAQDVERFRFLRSLPGAYAFVQQYQPVLGGRTARLERFFDSRADERIDKLVKIVFTQNMKSVEKYYRWLSRMYVERFGRLHQGLIDTIFRYNHRDLRGRYVASMESIARGHPVRPTGLAIG